MKPDTKRAEAMVREYRSGKTYREVGEGWGVSRNRVTQIIRRHLNIPWGQKVPR